MPYYKLTDEQRDLIFAALNHRKMSPGPQRLHSDAIGGEERGDDDVRQALIEPLAVTTLIEGARALENELADSANDGMNPRSPTGEDYNELFDLVLRTFPEIR